MSYGNQPGDTGGQGTPPPGGGYGPPGGYPPPGGNYPPGGYPPPGGYGAPPTPPNNHLAMAIITTILCCLPLGIVSIVYSSQVNSKWAAGDYQGALASSESAKKWWIAAVITGIAFSVLYIIVFVVIGVSLGTSYPTSSY
ncbi:hypothetical protein Psi02_01400 [Planotetraspora silvatica]|uniref:Interferon-induced transmembrane protein n=1 Tax=Planotetraspora silvatica TaxID=234614 RepID=A0A8J3XL20_9ACTN|nr:CD225/dispanin family protein [Planotetraspora silvatica]GII43716.1 hypothetical protein Psi02_01400 [Planotetraspora silvatica]